MEHKKNNDCNDDDVLSLRDLQMYDQTATSSTRSSPRTSSAQEMFEFFPDISNHTATGDIVFCGKLIPGSVGDADDQELNDQYQSRNYLGSSSFRFLERPIEHAIPLRSVSNRDLGSPRHGVKLSTSVKKVSMTSMSKRRKFMIGPVPEMEMRSIRERQGRRAPSRMFPVVEGGEARKAVAGKNTVRCRARLNSVFEKLMKTIAHMMGYFTYKKKGFAYGIPFHFLSQSIVVETTVRSSFLPSFTPTHTRRSTKLLRFVFPVRKNPFRIYILRLGEMENPVAIQLPEADSLPDGFVDSSAEPVTSLPRTPDQESQVTDYKEEKLIEVDSRPDLVVDDFQSCEGDNGSADQTRTFPVELSAFANCVAQKIKTAVEDCKDEGSPNCVSENVVRKPGPEIAPSTDGNKHAGETCQSAEKKTEQGVETHAAHVQGTLLSEGSRTNGKDTPEIKRKSAKRTFKTEKEFLEFTLSYHKVLSERDAAISMRDKLESLCRELQHQNKMLTDECKRVSTESQNLRLELSNKFQKAIKDVTNKLEEQRDDSLTQLKENEMLRSQLKQKEGQIMLTEQHHAHQLKQKTLELQIADLKIQQHEENLVKEQSQMKMYAEQVSQLLATEKNLRLQLTADGEKFQQFQDALVKSNEVFETFKQEIEKMTKSIKELKKENSFLKGKTEKSDFTLVQLVEERERMKKQLEKTKNQKEKLESLCRSLQAERKQNSSGQSNADLVPV
ncbi:hypothetical protein L1987_35043 [Smallanthus sonchifolius]|uniref:Uncharacterized protein n=1 Tax=Smallanthus sonchifolius TaxID=185202 RepID=A0ACB9HVZ1_9ASTR|nr:hypothetical protein L1987_35043 [Smallanthus sonchifolius]